MPSVSATRRVGWRTSHTSRAPLALVDSMPSEQPSGDRGGFAELAELHRPLLARIALRLAGKADIAEDLVQETLLRALRRFDQYRQGTHAGTWMVAILTNLYFDYLKHQKVERKAEPELTVSEAIEPEPSISEISDADLHAAVRSLEPELRRVVELCYLEQRRYREVAAILNVPVGTIGTRLMRARARLREILNPTRVDVVKP